MCTTHASAQNSLRWWLTTPDKSALLTRQTPLQFSDNTDTTSAVISINPLKKYQFIDGFGFALTGGSAQLLHRMSSSERHQLLEELFGRTEGDIGISYLRVSIGSSDLNDHTFSYDDILGNQTDPQLKQFSLKEDEKELIPVLKEVLAINPHIKILGSPWSAPLWMKTNNNIQGGMLKEENYSVYAQYFVKYIQAMKAQGITIDAITVQNEPFNDGNTPSMQFLAKQELRFVRDYLGPAFEKTGIKTKIILYDHNCDAPEYPISILTDQTARKYIDGSGFHLYAGPITALTKVHDAYPDKNVYFTEIVVANRSGDFPIASPVNRIVIGATRNWSKNVLLWNLAADPSFNPHTDNGGCTMCQGALTIDGDRVARNLAYYTIGHVSKFIPPGSYRIASTFLAALPNVAFRKPDGHTVLVVANLTKVTKHFLISNAEKKAKASLPAGAVATYTW